MYMNESDNKPEFSVELFAEIASQHPKGVSRKDMKSTFSQSTEWRVLQAMKNADFIKPHESERLVWVLGDRGIELADKIMDE